MTSEELDYQELRKWAAENEIEGLSATPSKEELVEAYQEHEDTENRGGKYRRRGRRK